MKHLFVPYEIALKLKEIGFDEECLLVYRGKSLYADFVFGYEEDWKTCSNENLSTSDWWCTAPIYQQVLDWFRIKHKIHIEVTLIDDWNSFVYRVLQNGAMEPIIQNPWNGEEYKEYYDALNAAIEEAINMLK